MGEGVPKLQQERREERDQGQGGTGMGHTAEKEGGEAPNLAPLPPWPLTQGSPCSGSLWCADLGRPGLTCLPSLPVPHPHVLSSSLPTPSLLSQATPCPQPRLLGRYYLLRRRQLRPKVQATGRDSERVWNHLAWAELHPLPAAPRFGSTVKAKGWRKDGDGQRAVWVLCLSVRPRASPHLFSSWRF